jgi:outer membrane protein assembly factor BamB
MASVFRPSLSMSKRLGLFLGFVATWSMGSIGHSIGEDTSWPQWRGVHRDGIATSKSHLEQWPDGGPKVAWRFENAGIGFSSVSVEGNDLFTLGKRGGQNLLLCLDCDTGHERWAAVLGEGAKPDSYNTNWGDGPRSTPTIDGDRVYALCDLGNLACFRRSDGAKQWSLNLVEDLGGKIPTWGFSESVLIDGERLMVTTGGSHYLHGLNKRTGAKEWVSNFAATTQYVSVIKHRFYDVPVYVTACDKGLIGIHAETGEVAFLNAATKNSVAVIPTPIVQGNVVYHTAAYGSGNSACEILKDGTGLMAKQMYHFTKESMENHHGGVVAMDGTVYGFSKALRGVWMAQDLVSGKVLWSKKVGRATSGSIATDGERLYCYDDQDGICYLAQVSREGWQGLGSVELPRKTEFDRKQGAIWAHPVIANKKLIIRDQDQLFAFAIEK